MLLHVAVQVSFADSGFTKNTQLGSYKRASMEVGGCWSAVYQTYKTH